MIRITVILLILFLGISYRVSAQDIDQLILNRNYVRALEQINLELSKSETAELYFKKGLVLEKMMNFEEAVSALETACRKNSGEPVYFGELAEVCSGVGNYTDAVVSLQKALELEPSDLSVKGKLAQSYLNLKDYPNAFSLYQQIWRQDSTNMYYNRYYAYAAYQTAQLDLAVKLYEQLVSQHSRDLNVYLNLATIYSRKENMMKAVMSCRHGLQVFPDHPSLLLKEADVWFQHKEYAKAQRPYGQYLAVSGDSAYEVLRNDGICLYFTHFEEDALKILKTCYATTMNDPILNFYMGACYKKLKQFPESIAFFRLTIETATPAYLSDVYHHLGQVYGLQRQFKESIEAYQEALKLDPGKVELLFEIATTYEEFGDNQTLALNYYQAYLKQAGEAAGKAGYALGRITKLKEELFFGE